MPMPRHNGDDVVVRPVDEGWWRVEYRGRAVESTYLEYAVALAVGVAAKEAISLATQFLAGERSDSDVVDAAD